MKTVVISAVNLNVGGTLTILRDCLQYLSTLAETGNYRMVALVYRKELAFFQNIEYIEMQWPKRNWINRLWCEYVTMRKISVKLSPVYLWLSLHDSTPNVLAEKRAVYCHNPFPYYKWKMREWLFTPKIVLFSLFSNNVYRKNIHQNNYVIVQQEWMRQKFVQLFGLKTQNIVVAPPPPPPPPLPSPSRHCGLDPQSPPPSRHCGLDPQSPPPSRHCGLDPQSPDNRTLTGFQTLLGLGNYSFIFASSANSHKNFECICQASTILKEKFGIEDFNVYLTVKGDENMYARWLFRNWGKNPNLNFLGFLDRKTLYDYYQKSQCLIFPSKAETWGLPITEFAAFRKPMLLADLPYARESAGGCSNVAFFDPDDPAVLAEKMRLLAQGDDSFLTTVEKNDIPAPVARSWQELFDILLT